MNRTRPSGSLLAVLLAGGAVLAGLLFFSRNRPPAGEGPAAIQVVVREDAVYVVTAADLRRLGWTDVDPAGLGLTHLGEAVALFAEGDGNGLRLYFHGQPPPAPYDRYTADNVYRLSLDGPGAEMVSPGALLPEGSAGQGIYPEQLLIEENSLYLPEFEEGRPWFWRQLPAPGTEEIEFEIEPAAGTQVAIRVDWFGTTESGAFDPDHHVILELNGTPIADEAWDGAGAHTTTAAVDASMFKAGTNTLVLRAPGDTGVLADIVVLDRVTISYSRSFSPGDGTLDFIPETDAVQLSGGGPVYYFDLEAAAAERFSGEAGAAVPVHAGVKGRLVFEADIVPPAVLRPAGPGEGLQADEPADFVAIGDASLLAAAEPLLAHREAQGLSTRAVDTRSIYDRFGSGLAGPQAIRAYLQAVQPKYILLVGDWSYDPLGHLESPDPAWLPSFFVFTTFGGETVSDLPFADFDGDGRPDAALGRVPARTAEQVEAFVDKTIAFETAKPGDWSNRILAVADGTEPGFSNDARVFLAGFPASYEGILQTPPAGSQDAAAAIRAELENGVLLFSYFGHGSIAQLGKDRLLTTADAAEMTNADYTPIMLNVTCLAGLFTHPTVESLAEAMLWNPGGGAVAALAATSLTLPSYQSLLTSGFAAVISETGHARIGDLLILSQGRLPATTDAGVADVLNTFLLFGDPALVVSGR